MSHTYLISFLSFLLLTTNSNKTAISNATADEQICGRWESKEKNLVVQVYKEDNQFKAKIVWFDDGDHSKQMAYWTDKNNPEPALRTRKILGMNVLEKLIYAPETNSWEDGMIYDAKSGRHWNSSAYIDRSGELKVKGYWHFKFIGKTITFTRL